MGVKDGVSSKNLERPAALPHLGRLALDELNYSQGPVSSRNIINSNATNTPPVPIVNGVARNRLKQFRISEDPKHVQNRIGGNFDLVAVFRTKLFPIS